MTTPQTHTLETAGAVVTYDVRPGTGDGPPLLLVGSPMAASGFGSLAAQFPDRTVVTYDPRGAERSRRTDGAATSTPEEHADDLSRVAEAVGGGPVDVLASSGGAVNALVWVARHPGQVRTLVAHEPPASQLLPDREAALAACRHVHDTYRRRGFGAGMAEFVRLVMHQGPLTEEFTRQPAADPAAFGLPADDDGSRDDVLLAQNLLSCTAHEHEVAALRASSTRIVPAVGEGSVGQLAHRGGLAVAAALGVEPVVFPGDHGSFLDSPYGPPADVAAFAARLREVLSTDRDAVPA
ncbi:pimeloyl-ACP methyl ester carboxylesterase [Geodermatophilus tzadiensis]|uniref:Pimeloyl-ACP methyl ester carboxylesterase n=1 Tax=Geodermatophilus tzadiensis TaxID=1137988 RepID=A0A2T0TTM0_9ACTN|nr:alpha/beta hydrolase [Geodermatophilus tzadiensis]PRY49056.1 pimeloyl-ACP methyl ester carboxylesterase [Geodermatophilus tzadiensis]